jgi:hypothetical protein
MPDMLKNQMRAVKCKSECLLDLHVEKNSNYKPSSLKNYQHEVSEDVSTFEQFKTPEKDKDVFAYEDVLNAKNRFHCEG